MRILICYGTWIVTLKLVGQNITLLQNNAFKSGYMYRRSDWPYDLLNVRIIIYHVCARDIFCAVWFENIRNVVSLHPLTRSKLSMIYFWVGQSFFNYAQWRAFILSCKILKLLGKCEKCWKWTICHDIWLSRVFRMHALYYVIQHKSDIFLYYKLFPIFSAKG